MVLNGKTVRKPSRSVTQSPGQMRSPLKRGPVRTNSATLLSDHQQRKSLPKRPQRLTRSQSVEPTTSGHDGGIVNRPSQLQLSVGARRAVTAERQSSRGGDRHDITSVSRKRQPFSFSGEHEMRNQEASSGSENDVQVAPVETRSPRVHFADQLQLGPVPIKKWSKVPETVRTLLIDSSQKKDAECQKPRQQLFHDDQAIISRTDELLTEVVKFISDIKSSHSGKRPQQARYTEAQVPQREKEVSEALSTTGGKIENLTDIRPSTGMLDSARSDGSACTSLWKDSNSGRPSSATSLVRSVSNEDIHGRIALTLQMIEQDELRANRNSGIQSSLSIPDKLDERHAHVQLRSLQPFQNIDTAVSIASSEYETRPSSEQSGRDAEVSSRVSQDPDIIDAIPQTLLQTTGFIQPTSYSVTHIPSISPPCFQDNETLPIMNTRDESIPTAGSDHETRTGHGIVPLSDDKAKKIFSFLDEVEKTDREALLRLNFHSNPSFRSSAGESTTNIGNASRSSDTTASETGGSLPFLHKIDTLIRKGSVELAKEQIILERKLEEAHQRIQILEETLINQRDLNMRNLRNSERDLKKRLNLQKEEFDVAFSRNEALINEMVAEKRVLQERCDKLMKHFDETEEKYKEQIKSLQQNHLEEIRRLRKAQINSENVKKQQWVGSKAQEIREMTVKGLEPEIQRIIQRHQQEMTEMRAWHADEIRETEERCQRKLSMQTQELRDRISQEAEETVIREKEALVQRYEMVLKEREDEFAAHRRRLLTEIEEERERMASECAKLRDQMREGIRKAEIKGEVELENLRKEYETGFTTVESKHESEVKSLKDVHEAEMAALKCSLAKKIEKAVTEKEKTMEESFKLQLDYELREKEKKTQEEFEKLRTEEEEATKIRIKRLQEKFASDLEEMDRSEKELKAKFNQTKSELLAAEEQIFGLKTSLSLKEKQNEELVNCNAKMRDERVNLTSLIRRDFAVQIESTEKEIRSLKNSQVELQAKHRLELEQKQLELEKAIMEKETEIEKIGIRVQQTISRKEETIQGLQKQIEKCTFQVQHLEGLLEEQRKTLVDSMTKSSKRK